MKHILSEASNENSDPSRLKLLTDAEGNAPGSLPAIRARAGKLPVLSGQERMATPNERETVAELLRPLNEEVPAKTGSEDPRHEVL